MSTLHKQNKAESCSCICWAQVQALSGGERRRLQLAAALLGRPNLLLLDEPTNDLDLGSVEALEALLADFAGCVLTVSHDRAFMAGAAARLFVLRGDGVVRLFEGSYEEASSCCACTAIVCKVGVGVFVLRGDGVVRLFERSYEEVSAPMKLARSCSASVLESSTNIFCAPPRTATRRACRKLCASRFLGVKSRLDSMDKETMRRSIWSSQRRRSARPPPARLQRRRTSAGRAALRALRLLPPVPQSRVIRQRPASMAAAAAGAGGERPASCGWGSGALPGRTAADSRHVCQPGHCCECLVLS